MARVVVVGAGISGLAGALTLTDAGHQVEVLELSDRVGGKLRGADVAGHTVDVGAESMLWRRPEGRELLRRLGIEPTHPSGLPGALWTRGGLHPIPPGTMMGVPGDPEALHGLLTDAEVARARAEQPVGAGEDRALGEVVGQALGDAVVDRLVEPLLGGVYAGHARLLSLRACLPVLADALDRGETLTATAAAAAAAPRSGEPVFATVPGGLHLLPELLAQEIGRAGGRVRTGVTVRSLSRAEHGWRLQTGAASDASRVDADAVLLATPAAATARLLRPIDPVAAALLEEVEYASMGLVTYAFDAGRAREIFAGRSGLLVPPVDGRTIKAATFSSSKWPWLAEEAPDVVLARVSLGRHGEEQVLQRDDEDLARAGLADLASALGGPVPTPVDTHVQRWGGGIPQYTVGHPARTADIGQRMLGQPGLALAGAVYEGVGVPASIGSAVDAARALMQDLPAEPAESASTTRSSKR